MRMEGKVAVISGAAHENSIGAAIARVFCQEGAGVVIGDVLEEPGERLAASIADAGGKILFAPLDVTKEADWQSAIDLAVSKFGKLDVLVSNAAGGATTVSGTSGGFTAIEDTSIESWDGTMTVNLRGAFLGTKLAIPEMRKAGGGSIIITSSQLGLVGSDNNGAAYHASKGALRVFAKTAAIQHAKDRIRVNSVHPGPILTSSFERGHDERRMDVVLSRIPMGRFGAAEEVAFAVLYLASDEASFVTGAELVVDGGWTAG